MCLHFKLGVHQRAILVKYSSKPSGGKKKTQKWNITLLRLSLEPPPSYLLTPYVHCLCPSVDLMVICMHSIYLWTLPSTNPLLLPKLKSIYTFLLSQLKMSSASVFVILSLLESLLRLILGLYHKNNECSMHATCVFWVSYIFFCPSCPVGDRGVQCLQNCSNQQNHRPTSYTARPPGLAIVY